jgi:hypothetical protein
MRYSANTSRTRAKRSSHVPSIVAASWCWPAWLGSGACSPASDAVPMAGGVGAGMVPVAVVMLSSFV